MTLSGNGCIGRAGGSPTVSARVVSPAGVKKAAATQSAPDDHFAPSPHCRVIVSTSGGVGECRWSPGVVDAATRGIQYQRKGVACADCRHCYRCLRFRSRLGAPFGIAMKSAAVSVQLCDYTLR